MIQIKTTALSTSPDLASEHWPPTTSMHFCRYSSPSHLDTMYLDMWQSCPNVLHQGRILTKQNQQRAAPRSLILCPTSAHSDRLAGLAGPALATPRSVTKFEGHSHFVPVGH